MARLANTPSRPGTSSRKPENGRARRFLAIVVVAGMLAATGCATKVVLPDTPPPESTTPRNSIEAQLRAAARKWHGTPHRMGGTDRGGVDCSGLVMRIFQDRFGISLPRSTVNQVRVGRFVSRSRLRPGDLVFFRPSWKKQDHVGIYMGHGRFLHASSSHGVIVSNLNNPYWRDCYWQARRVF